MQDASLAARFNAAPLRNRVRVRLNATPDEVWALVGDLTRFPELCSACFEMGTDWVMPRDHGAAPVNLCPLPHSH